MPNELTNLSELRRLVKEATPGPWCYYKNWLRIDEGDGDGALLSDQMCKNDNALIVFLANNASRMADEIEAGRRLREEVGGMYVPEMCVHPVFKRTAAGVGVRRQPGASGRAG